jgi:RNA polymerase sigma-70 factor, ECF subfamily
MKPAQQTQPNQALDDVELARRVAAGDEGAMRLLMRRHNQTMFRAARAILRDDAEAEDAVQDAYLRAFRAIGSFRADAKLSTWLTRIAVNESLQRLRKLKRSAEVITMDGETVETAADQPDATLGAKGPELEALRGEARRIIESRIDRLPDAFRAVFVLRAVEEMSVEETAAALEIPEATVRTRFFRARSLLREALASELDVAMESAFSFAGARCDRITERVIARLREAR